MSPPALLFNLCPLFASQNWLDQAIAQFCKLFPEHSFFWYSFNVTGLLAVILVSLICGAVGSLVLGNRMAFFSDALAHCAIAGFGLAVVGGLLGQVLDDDWFKDYGIPVILVLFGLAIGLGIAFIRENTNLASDTVIGVFFAGAVGLGGMLFKLISANRRVADPEQILFGNLFAVDGSGLLLLMGLVVVEMLLFLFLYNQMVLTSFNPVLARSRNIPLRLCSYLFIALLALVVNLCLKTVGALLINAMLIVPAATASNLSRNLRQMFWLSIVLSLWASLGGLFLNTLVKIPIGKAEVTFGSGAVIVVLSVLMFFISIPLGRKLKSWKFN